MKNPKKYSDTLGFETPYADNEYEMGRESCLALEQQIVSPFLEAEILSESWIDEEEPASEIAWEDLSDENSDELEEEQEHDIETEDWYEEIEDDSEVEGTFQKEDYESHIDYAEVEDVTDIEDEIEDGYELEEEFYDYNEELWEENEFHSESDTLNNEVDFNSELLSEAKILSAIEYNRVKMISLGWQKYYDDIVSEILKLNYSPNERTFAEAVAGWQDSIGLGFDGKIGSNTWNKMKLILGISTSKSRPKAHSSTRPSDLIGTKMPHSPTGKYLINSVSRAYGIPETIEALEWIGNQWYEKYPDIVFKIRDISQKGGGQLRTGTRDGKPKYHKSHQIGLDADLQLLMNGKRINTLAKTYTKEQRNILRDFIKLILSNKILNIKIIGCTESVLAKEFQKVSAWKGHNKHIHVRFCVLEKYRSQLKSVSVPSISKYSCKASHNELYDSIYSLNTEVYFDEEIPLSEAELLSAIQYNRNKMKSLGWQKYYDDIVSKIFKLNYSPNEEAFAQAIAEWQGNNGLDDDGKLGVGTWKKMQVVLGIPGGVKPAEPSASRKEKIASIVESNRDAFGISKANEKTAASLWGNTKLRAISASNINKYVGSLKGFGSHISFSQALFGKTSLALYKSGNDINFVMAIATREGGIRGLVRTDNAKVSSAGKDTHEAGISGLDYLYKRAKYFREVGIFIEPVPKAALVLGRENRSPAYIMAKHLMFAHMVEVARREHNTWRSDLVKVMKRKGVTGSPEDFFNDLSRDARRAWVALSYSGGARVRTVFAFIITDQKRRKVAFDFNVIMTNPFKGLKHKFKARVMLARATSLRAHVFDQFL